VNTEQLKIFESYIQEAIQHAMPQVILNRVENTYDGELVNWPDNILVSIMSFYCEKMQGTAVIGCDAAFLERTYPGLDPKDPNKESLLQDWLGELSNLVLGRMKNKLLPFGLALKLNPPSVTEASEEIFSVYSNRKDNLKLWFNMDHQFLCLSISVDLDESINFAALMPDQGHSLQPGDAIYRLNEPVGTTQKYDVIAQIRSGVMTNDDPALHDDFESEFDDDIPEPRKNWHLQGVEELETNHAQRTSYSGSTSVSNSAPVQPPRESFPDVQHANLISSATPRTTGRRILEAAEWGDTGELCLRFQGGSIVRLSPTNLLAKGAATLVIEGYRLEIQQTQQGIRVTLPELQMSLETAIRAA